MKKIILYLVCCIVLIVIAIGSTVLGIMKISIPDDNPVTMGEEYIIVPPDLPDEDMNINAMCFNIRTVAKENDKQNYWNNRKEPMVNFITNYNPDLIGFQEVTHSQYKYLVEQLGDEYGYYGIYRSGMGLKRADMIISKTNPKPTTINQLRLSMISEASLIFYRKSRFELLEYDTFWLSETPDKPSKGWDASLLRNATYVKLKDHYTDEIVSLFNTHFDHRGSQAKLNSSHLLVEKAQNADGGIIIMGDLNIPEASVEYNIIADVFNDTKFNAPEGNSDTGRTFNGFGRDTQELPIDFVFTNDLLNTLNYSILRDRYGDNYYISDHYAILVELEYNIDN